MQFFADANGDNGSGDAATCSSVHPDIDYVKKWMVDDAVLPYGEFEPQRKS